MATIFAVNPVHKIWRLSEQLLSPDGALVTPEFSAESLSAARQLLGAETIGDIYQTPFPLSIAPLTQPLTPFADQFYEFGSALRRADLNMDGEVSNCRQLAGEGSYPTTVMEDLKEPIVLMHLYNKAIANTRPWKTQIFGYRSDLCPHGPGLHTDQDEAGPSDMIGLAVSSHPTLVVSHKDTLDILIRSEFAWVPDIRLNSPRLQYIMMEKFNDYLFKSSIRTPSLLRIRNEFKEALFEMNAGALNIITGMDVHKQADRFPGKRVCCKLINNFNIHNNWSPPIYNS